MTQSAGQIAQLVQSRSVYDAFKPYENTALWGSLATAVGTLINPIAGAAIAVYYVTQIGSNLVADHFRLGEADPMARIARAAFIGLAAVAAAFTTICALTGSFVLAPAVVAIGISLVCFSILGAVYSQGSRSSALA